jgi:[acyl-carrier-protein] S-malonyltransferase
VLPVTRWENIPRWSVVAPYPWLTLSKTVRSRGTFMQEAVPVGVGAMAAMLSIEADELAAICAEAAQGEVVTPANFNSPGQIVIAGHATAVNRTIELAKTKGFRKAMLLPGQCTIPLAL